MSNKMTCEEFVQKATHKWKDRFPLITEFMDWTKNNGYWDFGNIKKSKPLQKRYVRMLYGQDAKRKLEKMMMVFKLI